MKRICKYFSLILAILTLVGSVACTPDTNENITSAKENESMSENESTTTAGSADLTPEPTVPKYESLMKNLDDFPITFKYNGEEYRGFAGFETKNEKKTEIARGAETETVLRHASIPASFRLVTRVFPSENAYEYVVYIENDGDANTGIFSELRYEIEFVGRSPMLDGIKGDGCGQNYLPYTHQLSRNDYKDTSVSGRPSHGVFPYYNLSYGDGGTFIAIGWPGTWYADYRYDNKTQTTTLKTGQGEVATYIAPGETLRTPLMGFVEYEGLNSDEQTNAWRKYYINDVMRKIDGELIPTYAGIASMSAGMTESKFLLTLKAYRANGINPEVLWMDAGWYTGADGEAVPWTSTGSLDMDYSRFPSGMADIGKDAEENDMLMLLWFEPENMRLDKDKFVASQEGFDGDWLIGTVGAGTWLEGQLMNLGDPNCREWIFKKICKVIDTAGVTGYRQDFNNDPAPAWAANDAKYENRTGMTENLYVQGYLALWDALIEKYGLFMDSCASGGGRNDLESMKRAVPLHYSDWFDGNHEDYDMKGKMTQVLYKWFPYIKNELYDCSNIYKPRMNYAPFSLLKLSSPLDKDADWDILRRAYDEYDIVREYFYSDYYELTEWSSRPGKRNAWMFYDPEKGAGYASIYFDSQSKLTDTICLKGLDPEKTYTITDFDGLVNVTASGAQLMEDGITVTVPEAPYCVILLINS